MPALRDEVEKAEEEGVRFSFLTLPVGAEEEEGGVSTDLLPHGARRPRLERPAAARSASKAPSSRSGATWWSRPSWSGRTTPSCRRSSSTSGAGCKIDEATTLLGNGVFAGGDFVTGPATVAQATCAGRDGGPESIDRYLLGACRCRRARGGRSPAAYGDAFRRLLPAAEPAG